MTPTTPMTPTANHQEICDSELTALAPAGVAWLWHGLLAAGNITLLTSMWKAGKTTLLALLLSRRKNGGALAGLDVKPGKTLVVTEETPELWAERARALDFGGQAYFIPRPFRGIPSPEQWHALLSQVLDARDRLGIDLAVFDPIAPLLRCENQAQAVLGALAPLAELTHAGMGVLLLHHPSKGKKGEQEGHAARGSGAMIGHVDIAIEMRHPGGDLGTRRRRFLAMSRHAATPRLLHLELRDDGLDYVAVTRSEADDAYSAGWEALRLIFEDAPQKLTRHDILCEWPDDFDNKPAATTLRSWLDQAVAAGAIAVEGNGRKCDPLRYWLPARENYWRQTNPLYDIDEKDRVVLNLPFQSLHGKKIDAQIEFPFP